MPNFNSKARIRDCEELMRPEVRGLLDLPLTEKIAKSKEIIEDTLRRYRKVGLGFSGGTDSLVLLHLSPKDLPVVFVNTRNQFPETYNFIDETIKEWGLTNFNMVFPGEDRVKYFIDKYGSLSSEFTKACCSYHKISPMLRAINGLGLEAFMVGIRGVEHEERAKEEIFSPRRLHVRVHPLLFWRQDDVLDYVKEFKIKTNPLYAQGYTSLGCKLCTRKNVDPKAHERAGRGKTREEIMKSLRDLGYT